MPQQRAWAPYPAGKDWWGAGIGGLPAPLQALIRDAAVAVVATQFRAFGDQAESLARESMGRLEIHFRFAQHHDQPVQHRCVQLRSLSGG